jgi:lysine/ornithine N-monooxygenase/predicted FMN-binding regulatory protein PaiB
MPAKHDTRVATAATVLDYVGVGFGPSNLALAIAAKELSPQLRGLFFERSAQVEWHPGLMLPSARMQISFLKDLVTLRDPASPFTFLKYTKAKGRLERFINLRQLYPTRLEYQDYLRWAAAPFSDQVRYRTEVRRVRPVKRWSEDSFDAFEVDVVDLDSGETTFFCSRNVVCAPGGVARPSATGGDGAHRIVHSSRYLFEVEQMFDGRDAALRLAVVGDGQSAAEIADDLLTRFPRARVDMFVSRYTLKPVDSSPFVNEVFSSEGTSSFYAASDSEKAAVLAELRNTNFGVVDPSLLEALYDRVYLEAVQGQQRLYIHRHTRLEAARGDADGVEVTTRHLYSEGLRSQRFDAVVLATGFDRSLDDEVFRDVLPLVEVNASRDPCIEPNYRVKTAPSVTCGLFVQGLAEHSHGPSDNLLSMLPFRAARIVDALASESATALAHQPEREYPPKRHLESDVEKLYALIERYRFATVVSSAPYEAEPAVTHVPLTLDRSRGGKGVLWGHMDRANPHLKLLDGRPVVILFHGPNAYISPDICSTNQLPTWDSMTVHVRGIARLILDQAQLVPELIRLSEHADRRDGAYRLSADDPRIAKLIGYIAGFEVEITEIIGRFKLSQDREANDRASAANALLERTSPVDRETIASLLPVK